MTTSYSRAINGQMIDHGLSIYDDFITKTAVNTTIIHAVSKNMAMFLIQSKY